LAHPFRDVGQSATDLLSATHPYGVVGHQQTVRWCRIPCGKRPSLPARLSSWTSFSGCPIVGLSTLANSLRNPSVGHCPTFRRSPLRVICLLAAVALAYTFRRVGQSAPGSAFHQSSLRTAGSSAGRLFFPDNLLRQSMCQPQSPWRIPCGTLANRSPFRGSVDLPCGSSPTGGRYLDDMPCGASVSR